MERVKRLPRQWPVTVLAGGLSLLLSAYAVATTPVPIWRFAEATVPKSDAAPFFRTILTYAPNSGTAHSPAIAMERDGFSILWFQGSEEGARDVTIQTTRFTRDGAGFTQGPIVAMLSPASLSRAIVPDQSVLALGNTIQADPDRPSRYLSTIVSFGGWAAASIASVEMAGGQAVSARKLNLSPILNRSHLVRNPVKAFADGDRLLPAYFEMGTSFGEIVRLSADGRVRDKRRIGARRVGNQPEIIVLGPTDAIALERNFDRKNVLYISRTADGGQSWSDPEPSGLPNPNSPVAALRLSDGSILLAFNDSPTDRSILRLARSTDGGKSWTRIKTLENTSGQAVRYPAFAQTGGGEVVLTYSIGSKSGIKAVAFNEAWALTP